MQNIKVVGYRPNGTAKQLAEAERRALNAEQRASEAEKKLGEYEAERRRLVAYSPAEAQMWRKQYFNAKADRKHMAVKRRPRARFDIFDYLERFTILAGFGLVMYLAIITIVRFGG